MLVTCVTFYIKKEHVNDFINSTLENRDNTIKEEGNLRFDVLQCNNDKTQFFLYEVDKSEKALELHFKTVHYIKWKDAIKDWLTKPSDVVQYTVISPLEK